MPGNVEEARADPLGASIRPMRSLDSALHSVGDRNAEGISDQRSACTERYSGSYWF